MENVNRPVLTTDIGHAPPAPAEEVYRAILRALAVLSYCTYGISPWDASSRQSQREKYPYPAAVSVAADGNTFLMTDSIGDIEIHRNSVEDPPVPSTSPVTTTLQRPCPVAVAVTTPTVLSATPSAA